MLVSHSASQNGPEADKADIGSLACAGRLHPALMSACLDRQMTELVEFGYGQEVLWPIKQAVLAEVSCKPEIEGGKRM